MCEASAERLNLTVFYRQTRAQRRRETPLQRKIPRTTDRESHASHLRNQTATSCSTSLERDCLEHIEYQANIPIFFVEDIPDHTIFNSLFFITTHQITDLTAQHVFHSLCDYLREEDKPLLRT